MVDDNGVGCGAVVPFFDGGRGGGLVGVAAAIGAANRQGGRQAAGPALIRRVRFGRHFSIQIHSNTKLSFCE
jgi:hypothetical protein